MKKILKKVYYAFILTVLIVCSLQTISFSREYNWVGDPEVSKWKVYDGDTQIKDKIICDDFDNSGTAYYYYIDSDGYMLMDTICPDYHIVDNYGRRLDKYGVPEKKILFEKKEEDISTEVMEYLKNFALAEQDNRYANSQGDISTGIIKQGEKEEFGPNLFIENASSNGATQTILGKGVVLKEKKDEEVFDASINNELVNYIRGGSSYSKSANATTYSKTKWTEIMALKGTDSYMDFDNPKNNFNKVTGRVAMQNISSSAEKDTIMTLIISDDNGDEIYSTSDFNYNSGKKFSCTFLRKTKWIRLELSIDGASNTRNALLRDLKFGFDRRAYEEEREEDLENERIDALHKDDVLYIDDFVEDYDGEVDEEGYTKQERLAMASNSNASLYEDDEEDVEEDDEEDENENDNDNDDDSDGDEIDSNKTNADDSVSGPNFDKKLKEEAERQSKTGPGFVIQ